MQTYTVTLKIEGRKPFTTTVQAPREGLAKTRAMITYMHSARYAQEGALNGQEIEYVTTLGDRNV